MKILLTDGNQRSALAVTRALGSAGINVYVGEAEKDSLAASSKYCSKAIVYPSPFTDEKGFINIIHNIVVKEKIDIVIPIADITSSLLSEHKKVFEPKIIIAVVDHQTFWATSDKNSLHRIAEKLNIPTPTIFYIDNPEEILKTINEISFPCIIKPSRSRLCVNGVWLRTSVLYVQSKEELFEIIRKKKELQHPFMIQRRIHGEGYGIFALCDKGEPKILFAHRRLREKPPWGGVSVLRESIPLDPLMKEYATRLLKHMKWHGVAMVEFKRDTQTGIPYLMEINGRFWGSLQLAIDSGIDFPLLLAQLYHGDAIPPVNEYRIGIRSRWLLGDIDHLIARLSKSRAGEDSLPSFGSFLWDFMKFFRKDTFYEIESWDDMRPSWYEINHYLRDCLTQSPKIRFWKTKPLINTD